MDSIPQRDNVIFLEPLLRARRKARRGGGRWVLLAATLVVAFLAWLAPPADPQPLALDDEGRPSMLVE